MATPSTVPWNDQSLGKRRCCLGSTLSPIASAPGLTAGQMLTVAANLRLHAAGSCRIDGCLLTCTCNFTFPTLVRSRVVLHAPTHFAQASFDQACLLSQHCIGRSSMLSSVKAGTGAVSTDPNCVTGDEYWQTEFQLTSCLGWFVVKSVGSNFHVFTNGRSNPSI